jgi:hypothetical protein
MPNGPEKDAFLKSLSPEERQMVVRQQLSQEVQRPFSGTGQLVDMRLKQKDAAKAALETDAGMTARHQEAMKRMPPAATPVEMFPEKSPEQMKLENDSYMELLKSMGEGEKVDEMKKQEQEQERKNQLRERYQNILSNKKY